MADTIRTEADLLNNIFPDNQADGSITAQDMRDLIVTARYLQPLGWEFRFDSQFTNSNRHTVSQYVTDADNEKITFSDNPGEDLRYPSSFPELWDTVNEKLVIPTFLNGFGIIRLSTLAEYSGGTIPHLELIVDIGSDPLAPAGGGTSTNIVYRDTQTFAKASGEPQSFNWIIPLFGGPDFVANGAHFILQSHNAGCEVWQHTITAGAIMVPNPAGEG